VPNVLAAVDLVMGVLSGQFVGFPSLRSGYVVLADSPVSPVARTVKAEQRADADLASAEAELLETLARVDRLRKQRNALRAKRKELFARGMRDLDEEDGIRTQEEAILEEQRSVGEAQLAGAVDVVDWAAILGDQLDPALFGGTVVEAAGSSGGA